MGCLQLVPVGRSGWCIWGCAESRAGGKEGDSYCFRVVSIDLLYLETLKGLSIFMVHILPYDT